jgi:hypothetical protein
MLKLKAGYNTIKGIGLASLNQKVLGSDRSLSHSQIERDRLSVNLNLWL